jgi:hypothetical protein
VGLIQPNVVAKFTVPLHAHWNDANKILPPFSLVTGKSKIIAMSLS